MANPNPSLLDLNQALVRTIDSVNDAQRVTIAAASDFQIEVDATDGDTIVAYSGTLSTKASITATNTGVVVGPVDCSFYAKAMIYCNTTTAITTPQAVTLQVSPSATDNVWFTTTLTLTPSVTLNTVVASTILDIDAVRCRLSIASAISNGAANLYLVLRS